MINSLIRFDDLLRLVEKFRQGAWIRLFEMVGIKKKADRIVRAWQHVDLAPKHWHSIPMVQQRLNRLLTGAADATIQDYVSGKYFRGSDSIKALSVGCGTGENELRWARTGKFRQIDAIDPSAPRIAYAARQALKHGVSDILRFRVLAFPSAELEEDSYDVVIVEESLHHMTPLDAAATDMRRILKPGGVLVVRDFVGPSRFQWTDRQVEAVDGVLAVLPAPYRKRWRSGTLKKRYFRPGRLSMWISDPSEAAESDQILPTLARHFKVLEKKGLGGSLLHLLLNDIAQNFVPTTTMEERWLEMLFSVEDLLIASGELQNDFIFLVCRK